MITAVDCTILRFDNSRLLPKFFNFYSQSADYLAAVAQSCTGTTRTRISRSSLGLIPVPVPPISQQQRVVSLLDEIFEALATVKANAEQNLQNARVPFESHLESVFVQPGDVWAEATLGETCEMYQPKTISTKELVPGAPYPVFGANGIIGHYDKSNHEEPRLLVMCLSLIHI